MAPSCGTRPSTAPPGGRHPRDRPDSARFTGTPDRRRRGRQRHRRGGFPACCPARGAVVAAGLVAGGAAAAERPRGGGGGGLACPSALTARGPIRLRLGLLLAGLGSGNTG